MPRSTRIYRDEHGRAAELSSDAADFHRRRAGWAEDVTERKLGLLPDTN
jgi:hypothetical protein